MMGSDPAGAPLSGLLVYVSSALSTPHLVYILAQTPSRARGSFSCNPPQTCAQAQAGGSSTCHWVPTRVSDKLHAPCCSPNALMHVGITLPTFKVGGWGDDAWELHLSGLCQVQGRERPGHGQRRAISSCIVFCPLCGPISRQTQGLARNCGGVDPSKRSQNPQKYRNLKVGKSELTCIASVVSEPSWLEGAELPGPPEL